MPPSVYDMGTEQRNVYVGCGVQAGCNRLLKSLGDALGDANVPSSAPPTNNQAGEHASVLNNSDIASV